MTKCPSCGSVRVVLVLGPASQAFCGHCGTRWIQDGSTQRGIRRPPERPARSAPA